MATTQSAALQNHNNELVKCASLARLALLVALRWSGVAHQRGPPGTDETLPTQPRAAQCTPRSAALGVEHRLVDQPVC